MTLLFNTYYHMDNRELMPHIPDKSIQLIISDPPYFETKGDFDFIFKDFAAYLEFMEDQARHYKRILADNGSLFIYGHAKKIAYIQVIFDKYFNIENNITWNVTDRQTKKGLDGFRSFVPTTERILFYSNEITSVNGNCIFPVRDYLRSEILRVHGRINLKEINTVLGTASNGGGVASAILSPEKTEPSMITEAQYLALRKWLNDTGLSKDYSALRVEYETLRRPFDNVFRLTDVWNYSQEAHITGNYDHPTQKPETLSRVIILSTSRQWDTVFIPFGGSGTEGAMCLKEKRNFIGCDTDIKHVTTANERLAIQLQKLSLF